MSKPGEEFNASMNLTRIQAQTEAETKLGRAFNDTEKLIFDSGFYSGTQFGIRDARDSFNRVVGERS